MKLYYNLNDKDLWTTSDMSDLMVSYKINGIKFESFEDFINSVTENDFEDVSDKKFSVLGEGEYNLEELVNMWYENGSDEKISFSEWIRENDAEVI